MFAELGLSHYTAWTGTAVEHWHRVERKSVWLEVLRSPVVRILATMAENNCTAVRVVAMFVVVVGTPAVGKEFEAELVRGNLAAEDSG